MATVILFSISSEGDVYPLVGLGSELVARGHRVILLSSENHASLAEFNGLEFSCISDNEDHTASLQEKPMLMTRYSTLYVARHSIRWNLSAFLAMRPFAYTSAVILTVDRPNLWADLYAWAWLGIPSIRIQVDLPFIHGGIGLTEHLPPGRVQRLLDGRCEAGWFRGLQSHNIAPGTLRLERAWRRVRPTIPTVAIWPDWILGKRTHRFGIRKFGFMPPPRFPIAPPNYIGDVRSVLVFVTGTAGTTQGWGEDFLRSSETICEQLNCRGIFLGGDGGRKRGSRSPQQEVQFTPLVEVLPEAIAIVHHGGIGTAALALANAVPQLVLPRVFSQPCNAAWLKALGVARVQDHRQYGRNGAGKREIIALTECPGYRQRATALWAGTNLVKNAQALCQVIEQCLETGVV